MRSFGLIGYPLTHSFSKKYFTEKFEREGINDCRYDLYEMADLAQHLPTLLEMPGLRGLNVTIPHKQAVLPYLSGLDQSAQKVGAVNVIRIEGNGQRTGFNSDYYGFRQSLEEWMGDALKIPALQALVLGTGGASKAVGAVLTDLAIPYQLVSRKKTDHILTYNELPDRLAQYPLLINCSPVGTYPHAGEAPAIPYAELTGAHWLYDLVYNPAETLFMQEGKSQGAQVLNGHRMLVLQAEKAWEIWNA